MPALTAKPDGSFEGTLTTLMMSAAIAIVPNASKTKDSESDYRIISRRNGFELGAGWKRFARSTGSGYISVTLSAPKFGAIYGNIASVPGGAPDQKAIIWNQPA
ncbi:MAG: DUF736 domain-containing protein [Sphingomonas sp.]